MGTPAPSEGPPYDPGVGNPYCWRPGSPWDEWLIPKVVRCVFTGMQICPEGDPDMAAPPNGRIFYLDQLPLQPEFFEYTDDPAVGPWFYVQWISSIFLPQIPPAPPLEQTFLALSGGKKNGGPNGYFTDRPEGVCHTAFRNQHACNGVTKIAFGGSGRIY